jgi:hypothetical protein
LSRRSAEEANQDSPAHQTPLFPSSSSEIGVPGIGAPEGLPLAFRGRGGQYPRLEPRDADCAGKLKKRTLTNLYNERPAWLANAHAKLDAAVAAGYGWPGDLSEEEILSRLLALNLERAAEEAKVTRIRKPKALREKSAEEMI